MLVISVTECPPALRGDLSKWLQEIDTGVYVGQVSSRVREALWKRVVDHLKIGRAVLVYNATNEQGMDFRIHNASWEPIDYDGLKLILRPSLQRQKMLFAPPSQPQSGFSLAAKMRTAKRVSMKKPAASGFPDPCVIIDLETTGLLVDSDEIIELGALRVLSGVEVGFFQALIRPSRPLSERIRSLTGLTDEILHAQGRTLEAVLPEFTAFLEDRPIVSHHIDFDMDFLKKAYTRYGMPAPANRCIDTLALSRRYASNAPNHKLSSLMQHFQLPYPVMHRALPDCRATLLLLVKLIEIREASM